jgi:hypothetical protein
MNNKCLEKDRELEIALQENVLKKADLSKGLPSMLEL